ncbi:MAG: hypothetical protein WC625_03825 [Caldisericia bacterium]
MDPDSPQLGRQAVLSTPQIPFPQRLRELSRASGSVSRYMFATGILQILLVVGIPTGIITLLLWGRLRRFLRSLDHYLAAGSQQALDDFVSSLYEFMRLERILLVMCSVVAVGIVIVVAMLFMFLGAVPLAAG